jgi:hypothetical protein
MVIYTILMPLIITISIIVTIVVIFFNKTTQSVYARIVIEMKMNTTIITTVATKTKHTEARTK